MPTIYDIAQATGFSAPTVSKALNGTGHLTEQTRSRILAAAEEMGYAPNSAARSLISKRTNLIGVIYDDSNMQRGFSHPLFSGVLTTFKELVEEAGYDIIFLSCHAQLSYKAHAIYRGVEGIAVINADSRFQDGLEELGTLAIPCVSTNLLIPGICTILSDNRAAGYRVAEYFVSRGHRHIGFLSGPNDAYSFASRERYEGFCAYLAERGLTPDNTFYEECAFWRVQSGKESFARLYGRHPEMTAVFAATDLLATGILHYAQEHGIAIPGQLSVVGFDDDYTSEYREPRLTTFRQDASEIARQLAQRLLTHIGGGTALAADTVRLPVTFIERDSVRTVTEQ